MSSNKILCNDVFHAFSGLNARKAPIVFRNCTSLYVYRLLPFLLGGNLPTFSLFLKRVTVLILVTTLL
ncbi:hypothetical protein E2C01_028526 [Portunus trituberculatus]|uniref:Uncharacterized protein n=1 Tax=Portunus trituberculatus TaxID=210409 RepID=A0A5B7ELS2_PORTR|nr:hypothetical protein [Portunus trituberculatus]